MGNKAVKAKLTNMLRGKEGKKRNNGYANLNRDFITLKINCKGKKTGKVKKGLNVQKYNKFLKIKIIKRKEKKKRKKKGKLQGTAKAQCRGRGL